MTDNISVATVPVPLSRPIKNTAFLAVLITFLVIPVLTIALVVPRCTSIGLVLCVATVVASLAFVLLISALYATGKLGTFVPAESAMATNVAGLLMWLFAAVISGKFL